MKSKIAFVVLLAVILVAFVPVLAVTNFGAVHISDANPTGVPALKVNQAGAGKIVEFSDGGTPVFSINNGGGIVASTILTQGATLNNLVVGQPTDAATATPAAVIDSLAAGANLLEVRDAATPVFIINNGGAWSSVGAGTHSSGQTINNWAKVAAPTAIATATPVFVVDSSGVSNLVDVRRNATPVFQVAGNGAVTGQVLKYASSGTQFVAGTTTITGSGTVVHGLTTPVYAFCDLAADNTGDAATCTTSISEATVTIKVWNTAATPAANAAGVSVNWAVIGTP